MATWRERHIRFASTGTDDIRQRCHITVRTNCVSLCFVSQIWLQIRIDATGTPHFWAGKYVLLPHFMLRFNTPMEKPRPRSTGLLQFHGGGTSDGTWEAPSPPLTIVAAPYSR
jgi:hypothetical protein